VTTAYSWMVHWFLLNLLLIRYWIPQNSRHYRYT